MKSWKERVTRRALWQVLCAGFVALSATSALAGAPLALGDLNQEEQNTTLGDAIVSTGNYAYYAFDDGVHGKEIWRTDGTAAGTFMIMDIASDSGVGSDPQNLYVMGSTVYFSADDGIHGRELWRTGGTPGSTFMVADVNPDGGDGSNPEDFTQVGGRLYFSAEFPGVGRELWYTTWLTNAVQFVSDITPGPADSYFPETAGYGGKFWFGLQTDPNFGTGKGLYYSDGTAAGTKQLTGTPFGTPTSINQILPHDGRLWFSGVAEGMGFVIWSTAGTPASTDIEVDLQPGPGGISPFGMVSSGPHLYFSGDVAATGRELYHVNSDTGTVQLVADLWPGAEDSSPVRITFLNATTVLFQAKTPGNGDELFKTNVNGTGATLVKEIQPGDDFTFISSMHAVGGVAYFAADDGVTNLELWRSDGTTAGTYLIKDIEPGPNYSLPSGFTSISGNIVLFSAFQTPIGRELWRTNGTGPGTYVVENAATTSMGSNPLRGVELGGSVIFAAKGTDVGEELWITDGSEGGTKLLADIRPGQDGSNPVSFVKVGDVVYFRATDGVHGTELWRTDGTSAGTFMVADINPGAAGGIPDWLEPLGNLLLFSAETASHGRELWVTNGTEQGTYELMDAVAGAGGGQPTWMTESGGLVYGAVEGAFGARVLFVTDGSIKGTKIVGSPLAGDSWSQVGPIGSLGVGVVFAATSASGKELYRAPGGTTSTVFVKDIEPGAQGSIPEDMVACGTKVCFTASTAAYGREPWITDGTAAGTKIIKDIWPGTSSSDPSELTWDGTHLWLAADNGTHGKELIRTGGTPATTYLVADLMPGGESGDPRSLVVTPSGLFYSARSPGEGRELWQTAGEDAITLMAANILPGAASGVPGGNFGEAPYVPYTPIPVAFGSHLFFAGYTPEQGTEPFALCAMCALGGKCYDDGEVDSDNPCRMCSYDSPDAWTETGDDAACDDGMACTIDSCNGTQGCFYGIDDQTPVCNLSLWSVTPGTVEASAPKVMLLEGAAFTPQTTVVWPEATLLDVQFVDPGTLLATLITPDQPGMYDVGVYTDEVEGGWSAYLTKIVKVTDQPECKGVSCEPNTCVVDGDCIDLDTCTEDLCIDGVCANDPIPQCCPDLEACGVCDLDGDLNLDGQTNIGDIQCSLLVALWIGGGKNGQAPECVDTPLTAADLDCNVFVDIVDITLLIQKVLGQPMDPSLDANQNGCHDACEP
jgi:ELWxxDGT repeat protein